MRKMWSVNQLLAGIFITCPHKYQEMWAITRQHQLLILVIYGNCPASSKQMLASQHICSSKVMKTQPALFIMARKWLLYYTNRINIRTIFNSFLYAYWDKHSEMWMTKPGLTHTHTCACPHMYTITRLSSCCLLAHKSLNFSHSNLYKLLANLTLMPFHQA